MLSSYLGVECVRPVQQYELIVLRIRLEKRLCPSSTLTNCPPTIVAEECLRKGGANIVGVCH